MSTQHAHLGKKTKKQKQKYKNTWGSPIGQDCISLNSSLCGWLAPRLKFLSKHAHGHPIEYKFKAWKKQLKKQGKRLERYHLYYAGEFDPGKEHEAPQIHIDAQKAIKWIAKNFEDLWD